MALMRITRGAGEFSNDELLIQSRTNGRARDGRFTADQWGTCGGITDPTFTREQVFVFVLPMHGHWLRQRADLN